MGLGQIPGEPRRPEAGLNKALRPLDRFVKPASSTVLAERWKGRGGRPACKIGVVLEPIEAARLMGILASADCVRRSSKANQ